MPKIMNKNLPLALETSIFVERGAQVFSDLFSLSLE